TAPLTVAGGAINSASAKYYLKTISTPPEGGAWSNNTLANMRARFGYSTNVGAGATNWPRLDGALVEAEYPTAVPANTGGVTVAPSGAQARGTTIAANVGAWSGNPTSFTYQWQRSTDGGTTWNSISGETNSTYILDGLDVGYLVRVQVTAANADGTTITPS